MSTILLVVAVALLAVAAILSAMNDPSGFPLFHEPLTALALGTMFFAAAFLPWWGSISLRRE